MHAIVPQVEIVAVGTNKSIDRNKRIWKEQYHSILYPWFPLILKYAIIIYFNDIILL